MFSQEGYAQLIPDSDTRLKTQQPRETKAEAKRRRKQAFSQDHSHPFKNKKNEQRYSSVSPRPIFDRRSKPATMQSKGSPLGFSKARGIARYSIGSPYSNKRIGRPERYQSPPNPFQGSNTSKYVAKQRRSPPIPFRKPKYHKGWTPVTADSPFMGSSRWAVNPRYSKGSPFKNKRYDVAPRYSRPKEFTGGKIAAAPKSIEKKPFTRKDMRAPTNLSANNPFGSRKWAVNPRYSEGSPFKNQKYDVAPRYSRPKEFTGGRIAAAPKSISGPMWPNKKQKMSGKFSEETTFPRYLYTYKPKTTKGEMPFDDKYKVIPRYTINSGFSFKRFYIKWGRPTSNTEETYTGPIKMVHKKSSDMHPSVKVVSARNANSRFTKEAMRKWNVTWNNIYGNNVQPEAVKKKVKKSKFDKGEIEIWNE